MPITVVVGGQYGSEGKGKVALLLADDMRASVAVRVGGPNSGHTVIGPRGDRWTLRQLPTASLIPGVLCVLPSGSYVRPEILESELAMTGVPEAKVALDPQAVIIEDEDIRSEVDSDLRRSIGSTATGIGAAVVRRVGRLKKPTFASEVPRLSHLVRDTKAMLHQCLSEDQRVVLEGTQGYGLSVLHSPHYPYVTARDTTAAGFLSEAGLSPLDVDDVVVVLRAFPIRVPGASGPLPREIDWGVVTEESGSRQPLVERTSVTNTVRRVARFDAAIARLAIQANRPTRLVLNHIDYVDSDCRDSDYLSDKALAFIARVEAAVGDRISLVGTGPGTVVPVRSLRTSA